MPGVQYCSKFTWFGGIYKDSQFQQIFRAVFAVDSDGSSRSSPRWSSRRSSKPIRQGEIGCVVGVKLMERFGLENRGQGHITGYDWACNPN